jgi:hypothetical protein
MKMCASILTLGLALGLAACGSISPKDAAEEASAQKQRALAQRLKNACSSQATYDRLKQVAFDEAIQVRNADPVNLDTLSRHAVVRVENPVVKSRDETLDVTVCSGRFILHIPPGAERAFEGKRQLVADIEYAAQAAADGSGLVYQISGAEPIIYRLAAFDLRSEAYRPREAPTEVALDTAPDIVAAAPREAPSAPPTLAPAPAREAPAPVERPNNPPPKPVTAARTTAPERGGTASPSFKCRPGQSRSERMVCSNGRLAALDREMSSLFYSELGRGDERQRADLRRSRDRFLAYRERCPNSDCVAQAYIERMDEIRDIAAGE